MAKIAVGWYATFSRPAFNRLWMHPAQQFGGFGTIKERFDKLIRFHKSSISGLAKVRLPGS